MIKHQGFAAGVDNQPRDAAPGRVGRIRLDELQDDVIRTMSRDDLMSVLSHIPVPCLERRVKRRLPLFDDSTLKQILLICRRSSLKSRRPTIRPPALG